MARAHPLLLADGALRRLWRSFGVFWAPLLEWRVRRHLERWPDLLTGEVERAITGAIRYLETQPGLELTTIIALWPAFRAGDEPRLRFLEPALQYYMSRFNNPDLRLFDEDYDPNSPAVAKLTRIAASHPINVVMEQCVYADRLGLGIEILDTLARLEDGGFYGTTHIVWGCLLLRRFSSIDGQRIDALLARGIESMKRRQPTDVVGDLFAERVAFLQWAGRSDDVDPVWIWRIVRAQRADGGWCRVPSIWPQPPSQHTSCLGLAALIAFHARTVER